ncbi:uncharacterized protein [Miscanthus floridulus]|uniref:uncharacterized protein n=1 Tax=Miscanthus floridulus TaxID=154761 RepID=UPI0034595F19
MASTTARLLRRKKKKKIDPNACRCCEKMGHWAKECPNRKQEKKAKAHLAQTDEDDEATLLMATFCALHDVEAKEKGVVMAVEGHGKALKAVNLDEPWAQLHLGHVGSEQEQLGYLDSGASNHMMGSKAAISELDGNVTDTVKFDDGSRVAIRGCGAIIFIIINIGQLDERDSEVLIKDGVLRIKDQEQRLLAKVKSFDALGRLEKMVRGLPHIKHTGELCDSCLTRKQRRMSFPKAAKYRAVDALKLVHGDLYRPITPATNGGRWYFLLLMDDCRRYMWLQLLMSKDEEVEAIKRFQAWVEAESEKKLRVLRIDRGSEFTSVEFAAYCADQGVVQHHITLYSP